MSYFRAFQTAKKNQKREISLKFAKKQLFFEKNIKKPIIYENFSFRVLKKQ